MHQGRFCSRLGWTTLINHEGGHLLEKGAQQSFGLGREGRFDESFVHELHPAVASGLIDVKGKMPGAQTGMTALFDVALGASKAIDQEVAKPLFCALAVVLGIHAPEDVVLRDLAIKCGHESRKTFLSNARIDVLVIHGQVEFSTSLVQGMSKERPEKRHPTERFLLAALVRNDNRRQKRIMREKGGRG